jgi:hypothetical protein
MENTRTRLATLEKTIEEADLAGIKQKLDDTGSPSQSTLHGVCFWRRLRCVLIFLLFGFPFLLGPQLKGAQCWNKNKRRWRSSWTKLTRKLAGWKPH